MPSIFDVSPFDGGWRVKIADTGEVLFFTARRQAIAEARALARLWPKEVKVKVWTPADFAYPLGAPA
jgi:hypothetical protein